MEEIRKILDTSWKYCKKEKSIGLALERSKLNSFLKKIKKMSSYFSTKDESISLQRACFISKMFKTLK